MKQASAARNFLVLRSSPHQIINLQRLFSKYRSVLLLSCLAMLAGSCHKEDEHGKKTVPFKAKFETVETPFSDTEDQITGTGTGIPIGNSTLVAYNNFVNFPTSVPGTETITAANGDEIFATFIASATGAEPDSDTLRITSNNTITGGTGNFAGVTGNFVAHGVVNKKLPPDAPATLTFDGTITY